tara:strand:+ start:37 stop:450 length:414 start_codon:yes stop_codon:yes gene_type:complete
MKFPKIGIASIVIKGDEVLLGKRKRPHEPGKWGFPGGSLKMFETFYECVLRETKEETGLYVEVIDRNPVVITNDFFDKEKRHFVTFFLRTRYTSGKPRVMEPERCEKWEWYKWEKLPSNLMLPIRNMIELEKYNPFN